jgi:hypothetical protein
MPPLNQPADSFDIFSGHSDRDAVWLEAVEGLANAIQRMHEIAAERPGEYFIFDANGVVSLLDNRPFEARRQKSLGKTA